jgi:hypothetical protein
MDRRMDRFQIGVELLLNTHSNSSSEYLTRIFLSSILYSVVGRQCHKRMNRYLKPNLFV